jgi:hypothetical protein
LEAFFQRLQDSDFSVWFVSSPSIFAYPTVLMLHTVGLAMVVGPIAVLDLRLLGAGSRLPLDALRGIFRVIWIGFAINATTGLVLFVSEAAEKGMAWIFYVKLTLIALALTLAVLTKRSVFGAVDPPAHIPARMKLMAAASLALWLGAITAGRLMAYVH